MAARDLCTLAEVRRYLGLKAGDTLNDPLLAELIEDISDLIHETADREFVAANATLDGNGDVVIADQTRTFYADGRSNQIRVGDFHALTSITANTIAVDILTLGVAPIAEPADAIQRGRPYRRIRFAGTYYSGTALAVTAKWGWPAVPRALRRATIAEVAVWFEREVRQFSETFNLEESRTERPRALTAKVHDIVARYRPRGPILV